MGRAWAATAAGRTRPAGRGGVPLTQRTLSWLPRQPRGPRIVRTRREPNPSYRPHNQSGRARAVWTDPTGGRHQKLLPGTYDSSESRTAFAQLQLELES